MGGKALKHTYTRRYHKNEYHELCKILLHQLQQNFNTDVILVESFRDKDSFGDADFLVLNKNLNHSKIIMILRTFNPNEIFKNGHVYSFDYNNFQIDLIITDQEIWETSKLFYKWSDFSNLIGKIYHRLGCKYGYSGLILPIRDLEDSKKVGDILISTDGKKIFEFLGLSWNRYLEGFNNEYEMFDYIVQSRFFNPESFKLENLNSINKKRNKRRKVYGEFVDYVSKMESKYTFTELDKSSHLKEMEEFFECPISDKIAELRKEELFKKSLAEKFNGELVMEWSGKTEGKEVGLLLERFKNYVEKDFKQYLIDTDKEIIEKHFKEFFNG